MTVTAAVSLEALLASLKIQKMQAAFENDCRYLQSYQATLDILGRAARRR